MLLKKSISYFMNIMYKHIFLNFGVISIINKEIVSIFQLHTYKFAHVCASKTSAIDNFVVYIYYVQDTFFVRVSILFVLQSFSEHKDYSKTRTICRIRENHEPFEFRHCFCDWRDRSARETALTKTYTIGNVGMYMYV